MKQGSPVQLVPGAGGSQQDVRTLVQGEGLSLGHIFPEHTQFPAGLIHGAVSEHHQVDVRHLPGGRQGFLQDPRLDPVVAVRQEDPRGYRLPDACVPSASQALVLLVDHPDAAVCLGQSIAKLAAVIGGAVIHQQQLKILFRLGQHRLDTLLQIPLHIVHRHDHAGFWHGTISYRPGRLAAVARPLVDAFPLAHI